MIIKRIILVLLVLLYMFIVWHWDSVSYGVGQLKGQLYIINNARPISDVLADPEFPDSLKSKLHLIREIRDFAIDSLGINDSENYQSVFDQQGKPILWVAVACPPFKLKAYEWQFPFAGKFSYKGHFNKAKTEAEAEKLKKKGYDTGIRTVSAWSTLGWFDDPILSSMLTRSEGSLANLIIHELTHATLYIKDSVDYNENLATFVGDEGARLFLIYKYGINSKELEQYLHRHEDTKKYAAHVLRGAKQLDSLFATFDDKHLLEYKQAVKQELIRSIIAAADTICFHDPNTIRHFHRPDFKPNNTLFISQKMYREGQELFKQEFEGEFGGDFKRYLAYLKEKYPSL